MMGEAETDALFFFSRRIIICYKNIETEFAKF